MGTVSKKGGKNPPKRPSIYSVLHSVITDADMLRINRGPNSVPRLKNSEVKLISCQEIFTIHMLKFKTITKA